MEGGDFIRQEKQTLTLQHYLSFACAAGAYKQTVGRCALPQPFRLIVNEYHYHEYYYHVDYSLKYLQYPSLCYWCRMYLAP